MRSLWSSPFRPFYLLGALYAPVLGLAWLAAWAGLWAPGGLPLSLWHGHEFLFGFSAAIILGIVLTALPSWAGTEELQGGPLVFLAALWLLGRLAVWGAWPWLLAAMLDGAPFLAAAWLTTPQVWRAPNPLYRLLLPILLGLALANLGFHFGVGTGDLALAESSLRLAVYVIVVLYALKGGVLVPIFTGNALREKGRGDQARFLMPLDVAAVLAVVVLAACDLARAPGSVTGGVALAAFTLHAWRCARWRGWQAHDVPLVFVTHLGFFGCSSRSPARPWPSSAWVCPRTPGCTPSPWAAWA